MYKSFIRFRRAKRGGHPKRHCEAIFMRCVQFRRAKRGEHPKRHCEAIFMRCVQKTTVLFISMFLVLSLITIPNVRVEGSSVNDLNTKKNEIIDKAVTFLINSMNEDGSFGDTQLLNDTAEAVFVLEKFAETENSKSIEWSNKNFYIDNVDAKARMAVAEQDNSAVKSLLEYQNKDGGFGLTEGYQSDVLDSILVLEAINACDNKSYGTEAWRLVCYIARQANSDGSYSYNKNSDADIILTSMALHAVSMYMSDNNIKSDLTTNMMNKAYDYVSANFSGDFSETGIEENLYMALAIQEYVGLDDEAEVISSLSDVMQENGSFYDSSHYTALAILLLNSIDTENMVEIYDMQISNTGTAYYDTDSSINVSYAISYTAKVDTTYQLKMTVINGTEVIHETDMQTVSLAGGEKLIQGSFDEFILNQNKDDGITVLVQLYDESELIKECKSSITMENLPRAGETEITDFSLELNSYYTYTGYPASVSANYKLLYNTNIDNAVDMQVIVKRDGEVIQDNLYNESLVPSESSVTRTGAEFTPDVTQEGVYSVEVRCLYNGECIGTKSSEFKVIALPKAETDYSTATDTDADTDTEDSHEEIIPFRADWIGPYLSDYIVYAGKSYDIDVSLGILYYTGEDFSGYVKTQVLKGDTVIKEEMTGVKLSKESINYSSDKVLSFRTDGTGDYTVNTILFDEAGNELISNERNLTVAERNKIALIADSSVSESEEKTVDISWNDVSDSRETYNYRLYRRYDGTDWETRSIWNESDRIKVLNIYPKEPLLETWLTTTISDTENPAGMGMFDVDSVYIDDYNATPEMYMYDEDGDWKYDVIYFGSWDANNFKDLSEEGYEVTQKFADSGRGVLFGHDTIILNYGHYNFCKFAEQLGIIVKNDITVWPSTSVSVVNMGTLTNFPWTLRGTLTIPAAHSYGQYVGGTLEGIEWMSINANRRTDEATGAHSNFYLVTNDNLGMIQTGHSNGQASDDERKVLANTLFYLHQVSQTTTAKDNSFYDFEAPDMPEVEFISSDDDTVTFNISSKDNGTKYEYYIEAIPGTDAENLTEKSNVMSEVALSDIKGYLYELTESPEPCTELIVYDENNEIVQNVQTADSNGKLKGEVSISDFDKTYYLHVFAVDNENNISEELILPMNQAQFNTSIKTDKTEYTAGETVYIDSETTVLPYSATADVSIALYDEEGSFSKELEYQNSVEIFSDEQNLLKTEWNTAENEAGTYRIKIIWTIAGEELASDETEVILKVNSGNESDINSDEGEQGGHNADGTETADSPQNSGQTDYEQPGDGQAENEQPDNGQTGNTVSDEDNQETEQSDVTDNADISTDKKDLDTDTENGENSMEGTDNNSASTGDSFNPVIALVYLFTLAGIWMINKNKSYFGR